MDDRELLALAEEAAATAYAPYSNFRVGAVVVTADGSVFTGANVENAAYRSTMCAEANAIGTAVAAGHRKIDTVAVVSLDATECYPCGNCRQVMREFGVDDVVVRTAGGGTVRHTLEALLPHSFGPESLPRPD